MPASLHVKANPMKKDHDEHMKDHEKHLKETEMVIEAPGVHQTQAKANPPQGPLRQDPTSHKPSSLEAYEKYVEESGTVTEHSLEHADDHTKLASKHSQNPNHHHHSHHHHAHQQHSHGSHHGEHGKLHLQHHTPTSSCDSSHFSQHLHGKLHLQHQGTSSCDS